MTALDESVFRFLNGFYNVAPPLWAWLGTPAAAVLFAIVVVAVAWGTGRLRWCLAAVLAVGLTDLGCARVLKPAFARERPCAVLDHVAGAKHCGSGPSMPSNHAANTMAVAAVVGSPSLAALSVLVGASRAVGGQHWPTDILGGWAIGLVIGGMVRAGFERGLRWA